MRSKERLLQDLDGGFPVRYLHTVVHRARGETRRSLVPSDETAMYELSRMESVFGTLEVTELA
jgi:hypothetical protein